MDKIKDYKQSKRRRKNFLEKEINELKKQLLGLHSYVAVLERKIISLEIHTKIEVTSKDKKDYIHLLKKAIDTSNFIKLLEIAKIYYNTNLSNIFIKTRKKEIVVKRAVIFYIARRIHNIGESNIVEYLLQELKILEIDYTIERSTLYNSVQIIEDYIEANDDYYGVVTAVNDIKKLINLT